jgi:transposase InsO family protein
LSGVSRQFVDKVIRQAKQLTQKTEERTEGAFSFLPHVTWSIDFAQVRFNGLCRYVALLIEEASRKKIGVVVSVKQTAEIVADLVEKTIKNYGVLPLVLKHDGGPQFKAEKFQKLLEERKVVSLPSVFHYPRYNARCERMVRDVKKVIPEKEEELRREIELMDNAPRKMLNGRTSNQVFRETMPEKDFDREDFIKEVRERKQDAGNALAWKGGDAKFQRFAVEEVLKKHQLCLFTKGKTLTIGSG